jgi:hypothetical protein
LPKEKEETNFLHEERGNSDNKAKGEQKRKQNPRLLEGSLAV